MKILKKDLVSIILEQNEWIDANNLSIYFDVSTRTIRNYINKIKDEFPGLIISSYKGYKIDTDKLDSSCNTIINSDLNSRVDYIIRKLISSQKDLSVYDLADQLFISDSSFNRALDVIKNKLIKYDLSLKRKRNNIKIVGSELNKRKLINNLISKESTNGFSLSNDLGLLSSEINITECQSILSKIFNDFNIYVNDYGFHTILLHVIVMVDRILKGNYINQTAQHIKVDNTYDYQIALEIKKSIRDKFLIEISDAELYYLRLVILNNCNNLNYSFVNKDNINVYVEDEYIELTNNILEKLKSNYCLDNFKHNFIVNLTMHIKYLLIRIRNNSYTKNPFTNKFKDSYPLIYDMATFIAKEISDYAGISVVDDEIAFIAFHIASYLVNDNNVRNKVNCCFIYANYHNFHVKSLERIIKDLNSELYISSTVSVKDINKIPKNTELLISCCTESLNVDLPVVSTNMFVNDADIANIRNKVNEINLRKKKERTQKSLDHFIGKKLFKREFYCSNNIEMIKTLSDECISLGLCEETFFKEVLERENLSSTSFSNNVAIPHSLNANTKQSFLSVVLNKKGMIWGENTVNIIMMIGTSKGDREAFKVIFDELIAILYEPKNVRELIKSIDYTDFVNKLVNLIVE
jgi:Transcriptional antiterminator